ncbi:MAG TPA: helix-turn-helix transcriptional regulator [Planctomycetota bacterium]|nr:helix-turn-helix transcriptional regulator [Planctomycetota bacterium]
MKLFDADRLLDEAWRKLTERSNPVLTPDRAGTRMLERLLRRMLAEQIRGDWGAGLAVRSDALRLVLELARLPEGARVADANERVRAVQARLTESFFEPWSLDDAAEAAGLSRRRFTQIFATLNGGRTFLEVLTELRLAHAAELLARPNHSIAGAAFSSGFGDLSHFYRLFRKRYGTPPGGWRGPRQQNFHPRESAKPGS